MNDHEQKKTALIRISVICVVFITLCWLGILYTVTIEPLDIVDRTYEEISSRMDLSTYKKVVTSKSKLWVASTTSKEQEVSKIEEEVTSEKLTYDKVRTGLIINLQDTEISINSSYSELSKAMNMKLYDDCCKYYTVSGVTVLMPMIISINETGGRADKDLTFSSLFPSSLVQVNSAEDMDLFNSASVLSSSSMFSNMAAEYWTRDRGALQMNGDYGIHQDEYYSLMGPSEKENLKEISKIPNYSAYTTREGYVSAEHWIALASENKGDRLTVKDSILRLASENEYAMSVILSNYNCDTTEKKIAMLSMYHGAGSMWLSTYKDRKIGYWNSGNAAYSYVEALTTDESLSYLYKYASTKIAMARERGINPEIGISNQEALKIYDSLKSQGVLKNKASYIGSGDYSDGYLVYPLKALYNYMYLSILYQGG